MKVKKLMTFCQKRFENTPPCNDHCAGCRHQSKCYDLSPLFIGGEPMLGLKEKAKPLANSSVNSLILKEVTQ